MAKKSVAAFLRVLCTRQLLYYFYKISLAGFHVLIYCTMHVNWQRGDSAQYEREREKEKEREIDRRGEREGEMDRRGERKGEMDRRGEREGEREN
jgi:hypothetical protein